MPLIPIHLALCQKRIDIFKRGNVSVPAGSEILQLLTRLKIDIMRKTVFTLLGTLAIAGLFAFTYAEVKETAAEKEIKDLILECYVHGAFNELNPDAMRKGFHPDFAIFSADGEKISRYPIDEWAKRTENRKSQKDFDPAKNKWDHNFASVDVTGGSAAVKIELFNKGEHVFTDYLSLLKFDSGWKIVAKVYHRHEN
jgi:hypothetical protein